MSDPVDGAIKATEPTPDVPVAVAEMQKQLANLIQLQVNINSTGRIAMLAVPADLTGEELLELVSWMTSPNGGLREQLPKRSPIQVMRGLPQELRRT